MSETGVVKFECEHVVRELAWFAGLAELNKCRRKLLQLRMVGADTQGIGYGNLSVRDDDSGAFYISGSGTGGLAQLGLRDVAKITGYDFARNWLRCEGGTTASSESLTHAAVYECAPQTRAVIHCHSVALWKRLLTTAPATEARVEYGTPAMAFEVRRLFRESDVRQRKIFAMAGHPDGVVAFGESFEEAFAVLLRERAS